MDRLSEFARCTAETNKLEYDKNPLGYRISLASEIILYSTAIGSFGGFVCGGLEGAVHGARHGFGSSVLLAGLVMAKYQPSDADEEFNECLDQIALKKSPIKFLKEGGIHNVLGITGTWSVSNATFQYITGYDFNLLKTGAIGFVIGLGAAAGSIISIYTRDTLDEKLNT